MGSLRLSASDGMRLQFTAVSRCDVATPVIYSRGTPRPGLEYSLTAHWELLSASDGLLVASGVLDVYDIAGTDVDAFSRMRVVVDYTTADFDRMRCEKILRDICDDLRVANRRWVDMLLGLPPLGGQAAVR